MRSYIAIICKEPGSVWGGLKEGMIKMGPFNPVVPKDVQDLVNRTATEIASGKFQSGDATDIALLRRLLLEAEHTWGTDTKTWLDFDNYEPHDLARKIPASGRGSLNARGMAMNLERLEVARATPVCSSYR